MYRDSQDNTNTSAAPSESSASSASSDPQVPTPAERARTIAARSGSGGRVALFPASNGHSGGATRITPHLHHVHRDAPLTGMVTVLLPDESPLVATALQAPRGTVTAMIELTDLAPVPVREPVRGLLWITGGLRLRERDAARTAVLSVAAEHADPRLLDAGHGYAVLELEPASIVLADAGGTCSLSVSAFGAASADPFQAYEAGWLRHLDVSHRDVVHLLARHLPRQLRGGGVRPLGIDRLGLRLRVETAEQDHDVRLAFSRAVSTPAQLAVQLRHLVGCPFLARYRQ